MAAAEAAGWYVHAERPAVTANGRWLTNQQGKPGFPDLVLCHPKRARLAFVELKRKPNKATDDQRSWLLALASCGVTAVQLYVPEDLERLLRFIGSDKEGL